MSDFREHSDNDNLIDLVSKQPTHIVKGITDDCTYIGGKLSRLHSVIRGWKRGFESQILESYRSAHNRCIQQETLRGKQRRVSDEQPKGKRQEMNVGAWFQRREKTNWKTRGKRVEKTKSMDFGSNLDLLPNCSPLLTLFYLDPNQSLAAPQPQPCVCSPIDTRVPETQPAMANALAHTYCSSVLRHNLQPAYG